MTKIFISYRRDDSADIAGRIYDRLVKPFDPFERADVFKDVDSIPLGVHFKKYLDSQVAQCQIQLVIIGKQWATITDGTGQRRLHDPSDFVRIEVEAALSRGIPVIPLLVSGASMPNESDLPDSLRELVYYNGTPIRRDPDFHPDMERLIKSLQQWMEATFALPLLEWVNIPAGSVILEKGWDGRHYDRSPLGTFEVAPFAIAKYPVTNAQFQAFVDDGGYRNDRWWQGLARHIDVPAKPSWAEPTLPRETVSWYEAVAFTRWLARRAGLPVMLPTETQWQWAAVGNTEWDYPYGSAFDKDLCNTAESGIGKTTPVNFYDGKVQKKSHFGVMDMSGNVWEWCLNTFDNVEHVEMGSETRRMIRGGSWHLDQVYARATYLLRDYPHNQTNTLGFRVCLAAPIL